MNLEGPFFGLDHLDARIARRLPGTLGTFVEIGGYDGVIQSNTRYFEDQGWRGVLVEAVPDMYEACSRNRPLAEVFHCACIADDDPRSHVDMTCVGLMSLVSGSWRKESEEEEWVNRGEEVQNLVRRRVTVPARTLTSVLKESTLGHVDLLVLDVEGSEVAVLQGLDMGRFRPRYIVCEDRYDTEARDYLLERGYRVEAVLSEREYTRDVLYV